MTVPAEDTLASLPTFELKNNIASGTDAIERRASLQIALAVASPELDAFGTAETASAVVDQLDEAPLELATLNAAIFCQSKLPGGSASAALALLDRAIGQSGFSISTLTFNATINAFAKCADGTAAGAAEVKDRMSAAGVAPNVVTFNALLDAQWQPDGSAVTGVRLLDEMLDAGLKPDTSTFTIVISLCAKLADGTAAAALETLGKMRPAEINPNAITLNAVIDAQSKDRAGKAAVANMLLETMERAGPRNKALAPTVVSYTSAIDCHAKCADGSAVEATMLLERMISAGLAPNHLTFGSVLNVQAQRGSAAAARAVLGQMISSGFSPNTVAYNTVINANSLRPDGTAIAAQAVLNEMVAAGVPPNIISFTSAITAQARCDDGSAEAAAALFERAIREGLEPDAVTLTAVLDTNSKRADGTAARAADILTRMHELAFLQPNLVHVNSALNACATSRPAQLATAERVLKIAETLELVPNEFTLSALFRTAAFCEPPRPDLARKWFGQYAREVEINDHVERALRAAFPGSDDADSLLLSVGVQPTPRCRRSASFKSVAHGESSEMDWSTTPIMKAPCAPAGGSRAPEVGDRALRPVQLAPAKGAAGTTFDLQRRRSLTGVCETAPGVDDARLKPARRRSSFGLTDPLPTDRPVSAGRRGSMTWLSRQSSRDSGLGVTPEPPVKQFSGLLSAVGGTNYQSEPTRRLSLSEKVRKLRSGAPPESDASDTRRPALLKQKSAPAAMDKCQLLGPAFFSASPSASPVSNAPSAGLMPFAVPPPGAALLRSDSITKGAAGSMIDGRTGSFRKRGGLVNVTNDSSSASERIG